MSTTLRLMHHVKPSSNNPSCRLCLLPIRSFVAVEPHAALLCLTLPHSTYYREIDDGVSEGSLASHVQYFADFVKNLLKAERREYAQADCKCEKY